MEKKVYINGAHSISCQAVENVEALHLEVVDNESNVVPAELPSTKEFIPGGAGRRMAKGVKMGIVASAMAMREAGVDMVDAIITGTGMGCQIDSEKFLRTMIDNDEQFLTPTPFIQSTHNTVGGQIALNIGCKGYNFTYVHNGNSFESALMDASLQLKTGEADDILVGGVDELSSQTTEFLKQIRHIKERLVKCSDLYASDTSGAVMSEGAQFFVLSSRLQESTYCELVGLQMFNRLETTHIPDAVDDFLRPHGLKREQIDLLILGTNGDVDYDSYYKESASCFPDALTLRYKHLCGEYHTASSFGQWIGAHILKEQRIPEAVNASGIDGQEIQYLLFYDQYRGLDHSFTLLRKS